MEFNKTVASHEKAKYWSDTNELTPDQVSIRSYQKFDFNCPTCQHVFSISPSNISKNKWCNFCSGNLLCGNPECDHCFKKSFASNSRAKFWSSKNDKKPFEVYKCSSKKIYFDCDVCEHEFMCSLRTVTLQNVWCGFCSGRHLCKDIFCETCFDKSFATHEKADFWSKKNELEPFEVFKNSNNIHWFDCDTCGHCFDAPLSKISIGQWCPFCGSIRLCNDDNCVACYNKSFASCDKSKYWSKKNKVTQRQIFLRTAKKYLFDCDDCKLTFESAPDSIVGQNHWCPFCVNKTEKKLFCKLKEKYDSIIYNYKPEWSRNKSTKCIMPFDFVLKEYKIIIELDGRQHFEQVSNWNSFEQNHEKDVLKMKLANNNEISMIRILQEDVFYDKYDWLTELIAAIEKLKKAKK